MWCPIAPKKEVNIKAITSKTLKVMNHEAHCLAGNRETKVSITLKLDMKTNS
jgi:hypothetical protein